MKKMLLIMFSFLFCILIFAEKTSYITDLNGRHVKVPLKPKKIICIAPGALRLAVYLQVIDRLVGVENMEKQEPHGRPYWIAHPELVKLPVIGPGGLGSINQLPDFEAILKVNPDIIFITYMDTDKADQITKITGIPVVVLSYGPFGSFNDKLYDSIRLMGKILGKAKRAEDVINFIETQKKELSKLSIQEKGTETPTAYIGGLGYKAETGINSSSSLFIPFIWINANNVLKTKPLAEHVIINNEKLLQLNPDYIFLTGGNGALFKQELERKINFYNALEAFKSKHVYNLYPFNWYVTNIGVAIADSYAIGKILFPDKFKNIDIKEKSDEIYKFLLGKSVYMQMEKDYGKLGDLITFQFENNFNKRQEK